MYCHIFNTEFNLGFGLPRSDTCAKCDALHLALQSSGGDDKTRIQRELKEHQEGADLGYQSKKDDKNAAIQSWSGMTRTSGSSNVPNKGKDAVDMITFDFQQNLPTPNLHHNDMFYARQMWTYNFGIHDCVANQGHMFMWDETIAKRGLSEVVSSLQRFFKEFNTGARQVPVIVLFEIDPRFLASSAKLWRYFYLKKKDVTPFFIKENEGEMYILQVISD